MVLAMHPVGKMREDAKSAGNSSNSRERYLGHLHTIFAMLEEDGVVKLLYSRS